MSNGKFLIVDDVEICLYVAEDILAPYGFRVKTAQSGFEAVDLIKAGKTYDIIFMDHMMPKMDGIETTKLIREFGYKGIIVALTADALAGHDAMFLKHGFDDHLSKPIDERALDAVVRKFVGDKLTDCSPAPVAVGTGAGAGKYEKSWPPEVTAKMLEVFCRDAKNAVATLRETMANGDIKLYTTTVHAMKSALANVGENLASEQASALESAGSNGNTDFMNANTAGFIEALEALMKKLTPAGAVDGDDVGIAEDRELLVEQMEIIKAACEDYDDAAAYDAIDLLKEKRWKNDTAAAIEEIRDALFLHSDFVGAGELAGKIIIN